MLGVNGSTVRLDPPKLSIIAVAYNAAATIERCLAALTAQLVFRSSVGWWPLAAVAVLGATAYVAAGPQVEPGGPLYVPFRTLRDVIVRPLPIEYASLGTAGALLGVHLARRITAAAQEKRRGARVAAG